jgi:hypothetical protein
VRHSKATDDDENENKRGAIFVRRKEIEILLLAKADDREDKKWM